jgi:hypothetical protein
MIAPVTHTQPTYAELLLIIERLKAENYRLLKVEQRGKARDIELEKWRFFGRVFEATYRQQASIYHDTDKKMILLPVFKALFRNPPIAENGLYVISEKDIKEWGGKSSKSRVQFQSVIDRGIFISEGIEVDQQEGVIWNIGILLTDLVGIIVNGTKKHAYNGRPKKYCPKDGWVIPKDIVTQHAVKVCSCCDGPVYEDADLTPCEPVYSQRSFIQGDELGVKKKLTLGEYLKATHQRGMIA